MEQEQEKGRLPAEQEQAAAAPVEKSEETPAAVAADVAAAEQEQAAPPEGQQGEAASQKEMLAAEELLRCREELRQTRETLAALQSRVDLAGEAAVGQPGGESDIRFRPEAAPEAHSAEGTGFPAFSRSLLSGGTEAGEDRYRQIMGL